MQTAFYFDQTRCIGCYTCVVACKDWNDVPAGPASWRRVLTMEQGKYPQPFVAFLSTACHHCAQPACVSVCPVSAITKRESDGTVVVNREGCLGKDNCSLCLDVCPYEAPQFGAEENAKMQKCDFCLERLSKDQVPICVGSCPTRALDAGDLEDMGNKYGPEKAAVGFAYDELLRPSVVYKRKAGVGVV